MAEVSSVACPVQNYAWGKVGASSAVAQMSGKEIDEKQPYAELWMGTHHKGPAMIEIDGKKELLSKVTGHLPYLFKVLSVAKALSIQAHPDKKLAEALHKERPEVYKDPNHKPEMTCAVTRFEAMCGFRPPKEIAKHLRDYPEFTALVGEEVAKAYIKATAGSDPDVLKAALKALFTAAMVADKATVEKQVTAMCKRLTDKEPLNALILRLNKQYPLDVGVFCPLFLNYIILEPGEAMFLGANEPHAYLDGDCIEAMACSDNVVRAGLTPKLRDTPTLTSMLTYKAMKPTISKGVMLDKNARIYRVPIDEFELIVIKVEALKKYTLKAVKGHSLALVYEGSGHATHLKAGKVDLKKGTVVYIKGGEEVEFTAEKDLAIYDALPHRSNPEALVVDGCADVGMANTIDARARSTQNNQRGGRPGVEPIRGVHSLHRHIVRSIRFHMYATLDAPANPDHYRIVCTTSQLRARFRLGCAVHCDARSGHM
eukprot:CAMPEP_0167788838 /NCGR_PEP_ID=MMETSP0111_2-20121227/10290_1 /TAXON_ID=91324 /ORGANISM="Lotharella globosa, Strain CCCM811" /LENGTH=484 /DNA_ID=CAMNT_0007680815 /DNA_START=12 /DNA_END=1467 /DNA_ORIENTATION=+